MKVVRALPVMQKFLKMSDYKFLVPACATSELKEFRGSSEIRVHRSAGRGCRSATCSMMGSGTVRAVGARASTAATLTCTPFSEQPHLVLISVKGFFAKVGVAPTPVASWQGFPNKAGPAQNGGFLHLDTSFDKARDVAQKHRLRPSPQAGVNFDRYHRGGRVFPKSLQSPGACRGATEDP